MKKSLFFLILLSFLAACTPAPAPTSTPTIIPTLAPTATPAPEPITGTIFWDANGSGLQDETSFIVPEYDPAAPPYFFELLSANGTDLAALTPGELATAPEPPIPDIEVCLGDIRTETDKTGVFSLQPKKVQVTYSLKFNDPNSNDPTKAFRYINIWNGEMAIEQYEADGVLVPEQHLNDTEIVELSHVVSISSDDKNAYGLMQGFLTYPFYDNQVPQPFVFNYFDIVGYRIFEDDGPHNYFNTQDGIMLNYDGNYTKFFSPTTYKNGIIVMPGVGDSHTGNDYLIPIGTYISSAAPNSEVWYLCNGTLNGSCNNEFRLNTWFIDPNDESEHFGNCYGHLSNFLVNKAQKIYRGQILGFSGDTGDGSGGFPQLHFHLEKRVSEGWKYIDFYRTTILLDPLPDNYWGSSESYWTVDNIPQFPLVEVVE